MIRFLAIGDWKPAYSKFGSEWYTFPGSHWGKDPDPIKPGIDFARTKETRLEYAFHVLLGHHGLFHASATGVRAPAPHRGPGEMRRMSRIWCIPWGIPCNGLPPI